MLKALFALSAALEVATGIALLARPSEATVLALGSPLHTPAALTIGRVLGAALLALGAACGLAHREASSPAARGLVAAMTLYNVGVAAVLAQAGLVAGLFGVALLPAVVLHAALAAWCVFCLRVKAP
ncbi:hypothetical protein [Paludisphaera mucosa]|uniref:Uncharacterized protein n=1 Tax=Paludisphaera mucosa TaxID=3030827 RepID=A0ABT6F4P5_9BACT|nr:hypothetical protein [Paludisphaera mucosa]MDG3002558.1 hypothetical protein [Paludisphaera mucosa]